MQNRMTAAEYLESLKTGKFEEKQNKYRNKPTEFDGKMHQSQHEANSVAETKLLWRAGEIAAYAEQVRFKLGDKIEYWADIVHLNWDGTFTVIDAKSEATRKDKVYSLKKRMMKEKGFEISEV